MNSVTTVTQPTSWRRSERSPQRSLTCTSTWIITVSSFYLSRARGSKVLMKTLTAYLFIYLFFKISPTMRRKSWFICEAPSLCFTKVTSASIKDQLFRDCNTEQHKLSVCVCWSLRCTVQHPSVHLAPRDTPPEPPTLPGVPVTQHGDQQQEQQRGR